MKNLNYMKFIILCWMIFIIAFNVACSNTNSNDKKNKADDNKTTSDSSKNLNSSEEKLFTLDELSKYDGKNGNSAYVAVNGVVYDVTHAENWNNGEHENGISAGKDLTEELVNSPHGDSVIEKLPIVGKLK